MEPLIQTIGLKKYFPVGRHMLHAVDGVDLSIQKGMTLGVVGESGCGKSTLGRTVLGLQPATSGQVLFEGQDITKLRGKKMKDLRKHVQIIFQDPYSSINPRHAISRIIGEPMRVNGIVNSGKEQEKRVRELMTTVGLSDRLYHAYPHELDGGRRQRVGIARALGLNPKFIVCDEPVSALDVSIQAQILNLFMDLQRDMGLTYMFITHDLSVVKHISHEIAVMYLGKCMERAPFRELFKSPKHPYTKSLLSAIPVPSASVRMRKTELIKGEITTPINPKPGCRFVNRCPFVASNCEGVDIPLKEVAPDHYCACTMI